MKIGKGRQRTRANIMRVMEIATNVHSNTDRNGIMWNQSTLLGVFLAFVNEIDWRDHDFLQEQNKKFTDILKNYMEKLEQLSK